MRLIDADALRKNFEDLEIVRHEWMTPSRGEIQGLDVAICVLADAPTIDATPVVRCADCKYLNEDLAVGEWDGSCRYWNTHSVLYSWFCSQGERKEGADNGV